MGQWKQANKTKCVMKGLDSAKTKFLISHNILICEVSLWHGAVDSRGI